MFTSSRPSIHLATDEWEKAGVLLYKNLTRYLELSTSLDDISLDKTINLSYLTTRIDSALESLQTTLGRQLSQTRSTLSKTRNKLCSSSRHIPEEILSEIFMRVVFAPSESYHYGDPMPMKQCLMDVYRALSKIAGVCTVWNQAALNRGALWSMVPLFRLPTASFDSKQIMELAIRRAGGGDLNLIADADHAQEHLAFLAMHATRFRTLNIFTESNSAVGDILTLFVNQCRFEPMALSHLSICRSPCGESRLTPERLHIFPSTFEGMSSQKIFERLSILQLKGCLLHWDALNFSNRLTTFCLQETTLGYDSKLTDMLKALASATQLRELKLIKIKTFVDPQPLSELLEPSKISLLNLESLLIQDVFFNTLRLLLLSVQSRSHRLSIVLTRRTLQVNSSSGLEITNIDVLQISELLERCPVHALLIDGEYVDFDFQILPSWDLSDLLEAMPSLDTLWINMWRLDHRGCDSLQRPHESDNSTFPSLVNLYLTCVEVPNLYPVECMVMSHSSSIQRVAFGGVSDLITRGHVNWNPVGLVDELEVVDWLGKNVPEFIRAGRDFEPPEFRQMLWKLW